MLKELVLKNRSYRGYDQSARIAHKDLISLIDHARLMPAMRNTQPLKYFLASDDEMVAKILPHTNWAGLLPELQLPFPETNPTAFIVVLQDKCIASAIAKHQLDVGIACATITLAAAEAGFGCCMIHNYSAKGVNEAIQVPENLSPVMVIAVGIAAEEIAITEAIDNETDYYRDDKNVHYVPKRRLEEIIVNG